MKRTILYEEHLKLNAKMVEFAGYDMPIEYSGIVNEHLSVRNGCGLFDVSHMGEILISGIDAKKFANFIVTSRVPDKDMRMIYGMMLYSNGGIVDDLMLYHYNDEKILLVVNASNLDKDFDWINEKAKEKNDWNFTLENISNITSQLALQGPLAKDVLGKHTKFNLSLMQMYDFNELEIDGMNFLVSRSGYTGEDGFEIYGQGEYILELFKSFIKDSVTPCGLGCRDTLRFEANMPLYGHEINEKINPIEATLTFALDFEKDFVGKEALLKYKENGIKRKIVGLELVDKGIARSEYVVEADDKKIGFITTGYLIPGVNKAYALAMLDEGYWKKGTEVFVKVRKNLVKAVVRDKKFLNKNYVK